MLWPPLSGGKRQGKKSQYTTYLWQERPQYLIISINSAHHRCNTISILKIRQMSPGKVVGSTKISRLTEGKAGRSLSLLTPSCIFFYYTKVESERTEGHQKTVTQAVELRNPFTAASQRKDFFSCREINPFTIIYFFIIISFRT